MCGRCICVKYEVNQLGRKGKQAKNFGLLYNTVILGFDKKFGVCRVIIWGWGERDFVVKLNWFSSRIGGGRGGGCNLTYKFRT